MPDNRVQLIVTLQPEARQQACPVLCQLDAFERHRDPGGPRAGFFGDETMKMVS